MQIVFQVCRDVFDSKIDLKRHENRHKFPGGFVCAVCEECFRDNFDLNRHNEDVHRIFTCFMCHENSLFVSIETFEKHLSECHDGRIGRFAVCFDCGACFEQKTHLK